jgi:DNA-binding transcriptional ArsR family regulator
VFGHRYRLELLAALAGAGEHGVCVSTLASDRGVPGSVFYPPLRSLLEAGLVRRSGPVGAGRRVFYAITESAAWEGLRRMVQDLGVDIGGRGDAGAVTL